jgi:hypothetical protein
LAARPDALVLREGR